VPAAAPGGDPQIGHIFRNMRAAMRLPREAIARRLATTLATVEDLESGAVSALPHWPETVRIVRAYCELLQLDPEPLLWRLQQLLHQGIDEEASASRAAAGLPPLMLRNAPSREPVVRERPRRERGGGLRRLLILAALPAVAGGLAYLSIVAPATGYRVIALLPAPLAEPARAGLDAIVLQSAPRRDGLKWIDIGNPRLRKGDKLQTKAR
jgi:transcriptional regulator with XRE-family HTH domain